MPIVEEVSAAVEERCRGETRGWLGRGLRPYGGVLPEEDRIGEKDRAAVFVLVVVKLVKVKVLLIKFLKQIDCSLASILDGPKLHLQMASFLFSAADVTFEPQDDGLTSINGLAHRLDLLPVVVNLLSGGVVQPAKLVQFTSGALNVITAQCLITDVKLAPKIPDLLFRPLDLLVQVVHLGQGFEHLLESIRNRFEGIAE